MVEQYQIDLAAAAENSRAIMERKTRQLCSEQVPGDTQRNLNVYADFSGQTFKHILVPIWLVAYTYGATTFQVVVNGYTGTIAGRHPLSWIKITLAVVTVIIFLLIAWDLRSLNRDGRHAQRRGSVMRMPRRARHDRDSLNIVNFVTKGATLACRNSLLSLRSSRPARSKGVAANPDIASLTNRRAV